MERREEVKTMATHVRGKAFVSKLFSELFSQLPPYPIDFEHEIEWNNQPRSLWPKADLLIKKPERWFVIEYDEDSDPGRSLIKYWPYIDSARGTPLTVIGIWESGSTIGLGFAKLARWMGERLMKLHSASLFHYEFIERKDETPQAIAQKIVQIVQQSDTPPTQANPSIH